MRAVLLVDHGSKRAEANRRLHELARELAERGPYDIVEAAHMEIAAPDIAAGFARCAERGAESVVVHPFFLSPGRHVVEDIPRLCREAAAAHPRIRWCVSEPVGASPLLTDAVLERIRAAAGDGE